MDKASFYLINVRCRITALDMFICAICALVFRRWGCLYFILTAAIAWSRIYLVAHWPSDVIATAFMAAAAALLMMALLEMLWSWAARRWAPRLYSRHPHLLGESAAQTS